jgi:DNA-binding transcriptional LysR family regulator
MIDKLEFLLALARERHFGRAAESVKQVEETLGVMLVNRGSRFLGFTPEGERVLDWARRIVGDARSMRQEVQTLRHGLSGRIRLASVPTALGTVASLTTPFRARHPNVHFTITSKTSSEIHTLLENSEIDAGLTYLDSEPLGKVTAVSLYREGYRLLTTIDAPLGGREHVTWAEVAQIPLCLLTPDTQQRRIIERLLRAGGGNPEIPLEADALVVLYTHVRTGRWSSVLPERVVAAFAASDAVRSIPIVEPDVRHAVGLVVPARQPMTSLNTALVAEARRLSHQSE